LPFLGPPRRPAREIAYIPGSKNPLASQLQLNEIRVVRDGAGQEIFIMRERAYSALVLARGNPDDDNFFHQGHLLGKTKSSKLIRDILSMKKGDIRKIEIKDFNGTARPAFEASLTRRYCEITYFCCCIQKNIN
jgi:hypothetical protein